MRLRGGPSPHDMLRRDRRTFVTMIPLAGERRRASPSRRTELRFARPLSSGRPGSSRPVEGPTGGKNSMATYNLSQGQLESLLHATVSKGTENAIISALKEAGDFGCGHDKIGV